MTMIGFMGPPLLKTTYKTLFATKLHFLLTYVFKFIQYFLRNDKSLDKKIVQLIIFPLIEMTSFFSSLEYCRMINDNIQIDTFN